MTELDLEIPGLAAEVIAEFGKVVSYTVKGPSDYDPSTGAVAGAEAPLSVAAIVEPDKGQAARMGLVEGADRKLTIAAESFPNGKPSTGDIVNIDGNDYTVVLVKPTYSGELIAIYEVWVRR